MTSDQTSRLRAEPPAESILVWNGVVVRLPALALRPASLADLADAVRFAADHGLPLRFTRGDHERGRSATAERVLTLDLSLLGSGRRPGAR